jgi:hypothetical protein
VSQGSPQDCNPGQEGRIISPLEEQNSLHYVKMIAINDGFFTLSASGSSRQCI